MDSADIDHRFSAHDVTTEQGRQMDDIRTNAGALAGRINGLVPDGREKSLAIKKLEEVLFWANAWIARGK